MNDTICAIATSQGVGAIAIIRVSGEDSISIVNKIFKGKNLEKVDTHTINYGHIIDKDNNVIDEVLVSVMKAPRTFTAEDTVEINTHGGISPTNKTLELLLESGCRLAEPGEFTKRAFLNGRIDLLEAEAVMDMIDSKTEQQRKMAINQISGKVSSLINDLSLKLNIPMCMADLKRISIDNFSINNSYTLEDIKNGNFKFYDVSKLFNYKKVEIDTVLEKKILNGCKLDNIYNLDNVLFTKNNKLFALYRKNDCNMLVNAFIF